MTYDELVQRILTAQEEMLKHKIEANSVTLNGRRYGKLIEDCPPNMKPTIFGMTVKADYSMPDNYDFLVQYEPPQPKTNADRIRAMTDEEMARFLWQSAPYDNCPPIKCIEFETGKKPTTDECIACWGRWLKQEVTE